MGGNKKDSTREPNLIRKFWLPILVSILTISLYGFSSYIQSQTNALNNKTSSLLAKILRDKRILRIIKYQAQYKKPSFIIPEFSSTIAAKGFFIEYINSTIKKFQGEFNGCVFSPPKKSHPINTGYTAEQPHTAISKEPNFTKLNVNIKATFDTYKHLIDTIGYLNRNLKNLVLTEVNINKKGLMIDVSLKGVFEYERNKKPQ